MRQRLERMSFTRLADEPVVEIVQGGGAIKPLIEAQHGLTLRDAEAPVEILVIEHIDRPTPN